jgi:hypothetical protein
VAKSFSELRAIEGHAGNLVGSVHGASLRGRDVPSRLKVEPSRVIGQGSRQLLIVVETSGREWLGMGAPALIRIRRGDPAEYETFVVSAT